MDMDSHAGFLGIQEDEINKFFDFFVKLDQECNPSDAFMVGDRLDNDIAPAKKLGMKTVWVRQGYAIYQSIDDESTRPDYIVDSIEELVYMI